MIYYTGNIVQLVYTCICKFYLQYQFSKLLLVLTFDLEAKVPFALHWKHGFHFHSILSLNTPQYDFLCMLPLSPLMDLYHLLALIINSDV